MFSFGRLDSKAVVTPELEVASRRKCVYACVC